MSAIKQAKFRCDKCGVEMETFASAAVWCSRGHRMEIKEKSDGESIKVS